LTILGALVAGTGVVRLSGTRAGAVPACPTAVNGTLTNISRAIVPIGASAVRRFTVNASSPVSAVQLSAPPEYNATQIAASDAYGLRFTASHAGAFQVQATWTQEDGSGSPCIGTAASMLTATTGAPLVVKPPAGKRHSGNPLVWKWACKADSDATPVVLTLRWQIETRMLPLFSKGGKPPYKFRGRAKALTLKTAEPCDTHQVAKLVRPLRQQTSLVLEVGRDPESGQGLLSVFFNSTSSGLRTRHGAVPLHVAIALNQGSRRLVDMRACTWGRDSGFEVARLKGATCWW
jgi:hypothetical protein